MAKKKSSRTDILVKAAETPNRAVALWFVDLAGDPHAKEGKEYDLVVASSEVVGRLDHPTTPHKRLGMDLYSLYVDNLPDWGSNEGLLKVSVDTKVPQDLDGESKTAAIAREFVAPDGAYAPGFLYRGVYRNVLVTDWINLGLQLYETDTDLRDYYQKVKGVVSDVPELKNLDVLKGIPYLSVATKLAENIIKTFGVNPDDEIWGEMPILEFAPTPGGAFLRRGIYVLVESRNSAKQPIEPGDFRYKDHKVIPKGKIQPSNHLTFGFSLSEHTPKP